MVNVSAGCFWLNLHFVVLLLCPNTARIIKFGNTAVSSYTIHLWVSLLFLKCKGYTCRLTESMNSQKQTNQTLFSHFSSCPLIFLHAQSNAR